MEGNYRYGIWNGPSIEWKIWCMEWNQIFDIPYKFHTCTFDMVLLKSGLSFSWTSPIADKILSSTRTVIRKLRALFVISVTHSNLDAKRRSLILILFSWEQGTLSPDFCMFTSVLPACRCVRRDSYPASIVSNEALCHGRPDLASCDKIMYIILRFNNWKRETIIALCKRAIKACSLAMATISGLVK